MIPVSTFNLLIVVDILFIVYSIVDHRNRLYANIPIAFLAGLLAAFLGSAISQEVVYEIVAGARSPISSNAVAPLFYFVSVIMFGYTLFMIYEVLQELFAKKAEMVEQQENLP
jgi:hypothetical protein